MPQKVRVKVVGSGTREDPLRVNLPTWTMVPGSEQPTKGKVEAGGTVEVMVPDDYVDAAGKLDKAKIRAMYKGQPAWDREDLLSDVV